jgi:hypothetical protein
LTDPLAGAEIFGQNGALGPGRPFYLARAYLILTA